MLTRRNAGFSMLGVLLVAALVLAAVPVWGQGGSDSLTHCDPATVALVLAAEDAYGYDWQARWQAGFADVEAQGADEAQDAEATEEAKLTTAKTYASVEQDATEEPGGDAAQAQGQGNQGMGAVPCGQLRQDVIDFILAQNEVELQAEAEATFTVEGETIVADFRVQMSGPQEVGTEGDPDAIGEGWVAILEDTEQVCWSFTLAGLDFPASAAHIHVGAVDEAGPPVVTLTAPQDGNWVGCVEAEAEVIANILANPSGYYVNVHTAQFPQGALRGQLLGIS